MFTNPRNLLFWGMLCIAPQAMQAQLLPSTDSLFFRNVKVGFSRDAFLTIEAASDLNVLDIKIFPRLSQPGEFLLVTPTQLDFPMNKGARFQFILRCKPALGGMRTAYLTIFTDRGDTTVELIGEVARTQPDVVTEPDTIGFGVVAPNEFKEIPYIIYGKGIDSIEIDNLFTTNDNGPSLYFEVYPEDGAVSFPHRMGPSDTLRMIARFTGYYPVGTKTGRTVVFGEVSGGVGCEFSGVVGKPEMQFSPQLLDLGIVPLGATVDTFIYLLSTGEGAVTLESITPPKSYAVSNIPPFPHDINQADSLRLDIRFVALTPGIYEEPLGAMAKATASGGKFRSALLKAVVLPNQLLVRSPEMLEVSCATEAQYRFMSLELTDSSNAPIPISRITSNNPNVIVMDSAQFPRSVNPGEMISINLDYLHRIGTKSDSAIIEVYSGNYVLLRDTVRVQSIEQFVTLGAEVTDNSLRITTKNNIAPFNLASLTIEVAIDRSDVVSLLMDFVSVHPSLSSASVSSQFDTAGGVYRIEIVSPAPIAIAADERIASIPLEHFYAKDSLAALTVSSIAPELAAGCLTFAPAVVTTTTPDDCNDEILRRHLRGEQLISNISIKDNPVTTGMAKLQFDLLQPSQLSVTLYDALGSLILEDFRTAASGKRTTILFDVHSYSAGKYTAVITARSADITGSASIPFLILH